MDLQARFDQLPFDTKRVRAHIEQGHTAVGDFLHTLALFGQARDLARPAGRRGLARGDADLFVTAGGPAYAWEVVALLGGDAVVRVRAHSAGPARETSVAWDTGKRSVIGCLDPHFAGLLELFEPAGAGGDGRRHMLDLWDWTPGVLRGDPGRIAIRPHDEAGDEWLVETTGGSFIWEVVRGVNWVRSAVVGRPLEPAHINGLFVKRPRIE